MKARGWRWPRCAIKTRLKRSKAEIDAPGRDVVAMLADVRRRGDAERLVQAAIAKWGRIDILVNNAGILRLAPLEDISEEQWDETLAVHLKGTFNCTQAVLPFMKQQRRGKIINIAAPSALRGSYGVADYAAAKGGILAFTRNAANELKAYNIQVNCVSPVADTRMTAALTDFRRTHLGIVAAQSRSRRAGSDCAGIRLFRQLGLRLCFGTTVGAHPSFSNLTAESFNRNHYSDSLPQGLRKNRLCDHFVVKFSSSFLCAHAPDFAGGVIGDEQRAIRPNRHAHGAAVNFAAFRVGNKPGEKIFDNTAWLAVLKGHESDLVTDQVGTVPRAVHADKRTAVVTFRKRFSLIEGQTERRDMGA